MKAATGGAAAVGQQARSAAPRQPEPVPVELEPRVACGITDLDGSVPPRTFVSAGAAVEELGKVRPMGDARDPIPQQPQPGAAAAGHYSDSLEVPHKKRRMAAAAAAAAGVHPPEKQEFIPAGGSLQHPRALGESAAAEELPVPGHEGLLLMGLLAATVSAETGETGEGSDVAGPGASNSGSGAAPAKHFVDGGALEAGALPTGHASE